MVQEMSLKCEKVDGLPLQLNRATEEGFCRTGE